MRLNLVPVLLLLSPLMAQTQVGSYDGRWLCVTYIEAKEGRIDFFIDPTTIKFDKEISAWIVWERLVNVKSKIAWVQKKAFRKEGEKSTILTQVVYDPDGTPGQQVNPTPLTWDPIIPGTAEDVLWTSIATRRIVPKHPQNK